MYIAWCKLLFDVNFICSIVKCSNPVYNKPML